MGCSTKTSPFAWLTSLDIPSNTSFSLSISCSSILVPSLISHFGLATKAKPKWLISEGTRIDEQEIDSEKDVFEGMSKLVSQAKGLVFVEHPIRDLDRVFTIYQAAHKNTRELVVTLKQAYFIKVLEGMCPLKIEQLRILIPQKEWGLMHKTGAEWEEIKQNFSPLKEFEEWEAEFVQMTNSITYEELKKNPSQYVVSMNLWEIANLIDIH